MFELVRDLRLPHRTLGELRWDGEFICDTLEDATREGDDGILQPNEKIPSRTAIPMGTYELVITMSNRFKREMPLLVGVPLFEGIRIHAGNTEADTEGCILVGERTVAHTMVINSRATFENVVFPRIKEALTKGRQYIQVRNA